MATKPIKFLGNTNHTKEYWMQAAKQIVWPVDYDEQHISVPHPELDQAKKILATAWLLQFSTTAPGESTP